MQQVEQSGEVTQQTLNADRNSRINRTSKIIEQRLSQSATLPKILGIAQIHCEAGAIERNLIACISAIEQARESNVELLVFPEATLTGYCAMDQMYDRNFLSQNMQAVERLREHTDGITVVVGFLDYDPNRLAPGGMPWIYNAAAVIRNREVVSVHHKSHLPTYGVFSELRHCQPAEDVCVADLGEYKLGVAICEDLWQRQPNNVASDLKILGADLIVSLNASPFQRGKLKQRLEVLSHVPQDTGLPLVYANLVGSYDGYDSEVVFDGHSFILNAAGELTDLAHGFNDSILITSNLSDPVEPLDLDDISELHDALVMAMRDFFRRKGMTHAFIGISGGIDSAVVAALAVEALGASNVTGITMPSVITSAETLSDAHLLAQRLGIECIERPIVAEMRAWESEYKRSKGVPPQGLTKQNKQARIRSAILAEYTNDTPRSLFLNTGNKTEIALGYFTLGGDSCGALAVLGDVGKLLVYDLARFINRTAHSELIPLSTIERAPTAELEPGQSDEKSFKIAYAELDPLVTAIVEEGLEDTTFGPMIDRAEGKRRQLPPAIRVTSRAFGIERRVPMDRANFQQKNS